jgi:hypothetical protein
MKKLMIVVAVLFIAVSTQAANVNWTWATVLEDTGFSPVTGVVAFYLSAGAPAAGATAFDSASATGNFGNSTVIIDSVAYNGGTGWMRITANGYYVQTSFAIAGLGVDAPTDSSSITGWVNGSANTLLTSFGNGSQLDLTDQVASGWTAVPEPTSMALLALGVAAVGLRRRFRK